MSVGIGSNISSLRAQRRLSEGTNTLSRVFESLSSGLRINRASDDAAGLAIASSLKTDTRVFSQAIRNINDGLSLLAIGEGALRQLSSISIRQLELAEQAANGSYSVQQRKSLNDEARALSLEFRRIIDSVDFNDKKILDRNVTDDLRIQAGYGLDGSLAISALGTRIGADLTVSNGTLQAAKNYVTGGAVGTNLTQGDFNGDGLIDLAVAEGGSNDRIWVTLANGDGTFKAATPFQTGNVYVGASAGDFNGDGILDLISGGGAAVNVLIGNGDGTFKARIISHGPSTTRAIAPIDINGDGRLDAVFVDGSGNNLTVMLGNGNGTFLARQTFVVNTTPFDMKLGDFNGDGLIDAAVVEFTPGGGVSILLGNGDGSFKARTSIATGYVSVGLAAGDFNGDGIQDLTVGNYEGTTLGVLLGNGDGTFKIGATPAVGANPFAVSAVDINGDEKLDLISTDFNSATVSVMIGNGDGTFQAGKSFGTGTGPRSLQIADFNGDGALDVAALNTGPGNFSVLFSNTMQIIGIADINISTRSGALKAIDLLNSTIRNISEKLGTIGSAQSRLGVAIGNLSVGRENFEAAASRIQDADIAGESANLTRLAILQQSAAAVLAQANQQPALAITLLTN